MGWQRFLYALGNFAAAVKRPSRVAGVTGSHDSRSPANRSYESCRAIAAAGLTRAWRHQLAAGPATPPTNCSSPPTAPCTKPGKGGFVIHAQGVEGVSLVPAADAHHAGFAETALP
jgi:hypothetical protein